MVSQIHGIIHHRQASMEESRVCVERAACMQQEDAVMRMLLVLVMGMQATGALPAAPILSFVKQLHATV